jgi:hypothetical protein
MFYILWFSPKKDLWNVNKLYSTLLYGNGGAQGEKLLVEGNV